MDIDTITGAAGTVELGGRLLTMRQLTVGDVGDLTAWLKERSPKPYAVAVKAIADLKPLEAIDADAYKTERDAILLAAREDTKTGAIADPASADVLMNGIDGLAYVLWLTVKRKHPEVTFEWLKGALGDCDLESIKGKLDAINREWVKHVPKNPEAAGQ